MRPRDTGASSACLGLKLALELQAECSHRHQQKHRTPASHSVALRRSAGSRVHHASTTQASSHFIPLRAPNACFLILVSQGPHSVHSSPASAGNLTLVFISSLMYSITVVELWWVHLKHEIKK